MKSKKIAGDNITEMDDLKYVEVWRAFKYKGESLRCVPANVNGGEMAVCRSCYFEKGRNKLMCRCEGMCVCCGHNRPDRIPVKFISADLNCIMNDRMREMAQMADLNNRW